MQDNSDTTISITYSIDNKDSTQDSIFKVNTALQTVVIADTSEFGEALFIDGRLQSTKADEYIYHEMMVHSLLVGLKSRKKILILGGSEGCIIREVLKWEDVETVTQVDWDKELVDLFKTKYSSWNSGAYQDNRVKVVHEDAEKFLWMDLNKYDAIFMDLFDPSEENLPKYKNIIQLILPHLHNEGGFAMNAGSVSPLKEELCEKIADWLLNFTVYRDAMHIEVPSYIQQWCLLFGFPKRWSEEIFLNKVPKCKRFTIESMRRAFRWEKDYSNSLTQFWKN
jgi:spermidine synthase